MMGYKRTSTSPHLAHPPRPSAASRLLIRSPCLHAKSHCIHIPDSFNFSPFSCLCGLPWTEHFPVTRAPHDAVHAVVSSLS